MYLFNIGISIRIDYEKKRCRLKHCRQNQESKEYNNPDADAYIEVGFAKKKLFGSRNILSSFQEAKNDIDQYIKFYNNERPHSALGYLSLKSFVNL